MIPKFSPRRVFLMRGIVFILAIFLFDQIAGRVLFFCFQMEKTGEYAVANHLVYRANEDVLVLGSSRASHHYNPKIVSNSLAMSCYNGGRDGQGIEYYAAIFNLTLERYTPRVVILDINNRDLDADSEKRDNLSCLLPYLATSHVVDSFLLQKSPFELLKASLLTYRFNGQLFSIVQHTLFSRFSSPNTFGFKPLQERMSEGSLPKKTSVLKPENIDQDNVKTLENIISLCRRKGIKLFVFISPRYSEDPTTQSVEKVKSVCSLMNVDFKDFTHSTEFSSPAYFADASHLNAAGADLYTTAVVDFIKNSSAQNSLKKIER